MTEKKHDLTLSKFFEVELLIALYPTKDEFLNSLMYNYKDQEWDSDSKNEDVIYTKLHRIEMVQ